MAQEKQLTRRSRPSRWKRFWRWLGLVLLGFFLGLTLLALYFNKIDLPKPFKDLVLAEFSKSGWDLQFSRMRLRWYRGLVIEDLRLRHQRNLNAPELLAPDAELRINRLALTRLEMRIDAILLRHGQLTWTPPEGGEQIRATGVELKAHRLEADDWELGMLRGNLLGVNVDLQGAITNALDLAQWSWPHRKQPPDPSAGPEQILNLIRQLQFSTNATLIGSCWGDGRSPESFRALLQLQTERLTFPRALATGFTASAELFPPTRGQKQSRLRVFLAGASARYGPFEAGAFRLSGQVRSSLPSLQSTNVQFTAIFETLRHPRAALTNLSVVAKLKPPEGGGLPTGEADIVLESVGTPWAHAGGIRSQARCAPAPDQADTYQSELTLSAQHLQTRWGASGPTQLRAEAAHRGAQPWPASLDFSLDTKQVDTRWGQCQQLDVAAEGSPPRSLLATNLTWSERLAEMPAKLTVAVAGLRSENVEVDALEAKVDWRSPLLVVHTTNRLYGGEMSLAAHVDALTGMTEFAGQSDFDLQRISPLLSTNGQRWMEKYSWRSAPRLHGRGQLRLPAWTNRQPEWRTEILPTLSLFGGFEIGSGAYKDVQFESARSTCLLSNLIWQLPALEITRPEGRLQASYQSHVQERKFQWELEGVFDPRALKPLIEKPAAQKKLDELEFSAAPRVIGLVTGQWGHPELLSVSAAIGATNFMFRQQPVGYAASTIHYTNQFLSFIDPEVIRPGEHGAAAGLGLDIREHRLYLTNAISTLDLEAVAIAIGDKTAQTMEPYRFVRPPSVRAEGHVDTRRGSHETDLRFELEAGSFHWKRCHLDQVMGNVLWMGERLVLTNILGRFGQGQVAGHAQFDFMPSEGATFAFHATAAEVELRHLNQSFFNQTNRLEGLLSGLLVITNATTADTNSWMGYGEAHLQDGLIWDIPVFSVFSSILNVFIPGLGNSRARRAEASFGVTNSVVWTRDLAIDATAMRMQYDGTVGLDGRISGRMEAELLRNMPAVGFLLSRLLWPVTKLFEYRVSGTLAKPDTEPVWIIPRILFLPFQPLKILGDLLPEGKPAEPDPQ